MCCVAYLGVVVRHLGEEVVGDMRVCNVVVQRVEQPAVVAVHGGECAAQPVPLILAVMRQLCSSSGGVEALWVEVATQV